MTDLEERLLVQLAVTDAMRHRRHERRPDGRHCYVCGRVAPCPVEQALTALEADRD